MGGVIVHHHAPLFHSRLCPSRFLLTYIDSKRHTKLRFLLKGFFLSLILRVFAPLPLSGSQSNPSEIELIQRCKKGDREAFDELICLHQDRVYNLALRLLGNNEDALDLAQEVFLTCFRKIGSFRGEAALSTWLYRVTVNRARNFWKRSHRRGDHQKISMDEPVTLQDHDQVPFQLADSNPGPGKIAAGKELLSILEQKLELLTFDQRQVLILRFTEGLSYEEIAGILGCSLGTVKSRLNRARAELRKLMEPFS